ncbi:MAG TPA: hypothetical protein VHB79_32805 [Polyangiaceae bacterium]|nr:hypothetical protein [Polyangiaceae bacterium]
MRACLRLLAALLPCIVSCSSTDDGTGNSGGQPSGVAGTSAAGGAGGGGSAGVAGSSVVPTAGTNTGGTGITVGGSGGSGTAGGGAGPGGGTGGSASGGAGQAGSGGSSGSGGGGGGGVAPAGCAGVTNAKFCEDWDKQAMGKPSGDFSVSDGVVVDTTKAFSGGQSLHFLKIPKPADGTPNIRFTKQFPLASNDMHGRVMLYMAQVPQTTSHWNFITSSNSGGTEWSIGGQYGKFELVCDPPDNGLDSKTQFPGGKWACMQWEFKYPGNDNTTFVTKVDGVSVDQGEFTGANSKGEKWKAGTWNNLKIGWEIFGNSDIDVEFWIDDLAFGEEVIPCPAK